MSPISKPQVDKLLCVNCESEFKVSYRPEDVSRSPIFCCFCGDELDFDTQDDEEADKEHE